MLMARPVTSFKTSIPGPQAGQGKDGSGSGALAARYRDWLLVRAKNVCGDVNDAEDLVQEVMLRFLQAFEKGEGLPSGGACEAWLVTTLSRLFYDQCRRRKVRAHWARDPHLRGEAMVVHEPGGSSGQDRVSDEQFAQALRGLSPKLRTTLEMHVTGQKYQDIARSLGLSVGTVSKRLHDARARLHELLEPHTRVDLN